MKRKDAGAGETAIDLRFGSVFMQTQITLASDIVEVEWTLPSGNWWRVHLVSAPVSASLALAPIEVFCEFYFGTVPLMKLIGPTDRPGPGFNGNVQFALGVPVLDNVARNNVMLPLPDIFVPGGTRVVLILYTTAGVISVPPAFLIARAVANMPEDDSA